MICAVLVSIYVMDLIYTPVTCSRLFVISGDTIHEQPETCQDSADCPLDFCCRGQRGDIIDLSGTFDSVGPVLTRTNGTCDPLRAQFGERCNEFCPCDTGLRCFHPLVGNKMISMACMDKTYVDQEIEHFLQCYEDKKCQLPISKDTDS